MVTTASPIPISRYRPVLFQEQGGYPVKWRVPHPPVGVSFVAGLMPMHKDALSRFSCSAMARRTNAGSSSPIAFRWVLASSDMQESIVLASTSPPAAPGAAFSRSRAKDGLTGERPAPYNHDKE